MLLNECYLSKTCLKRERDDHRAEAQEPGLVLEDGLVVDDEDHDDADGQQRRLTHRVRKLRRNPSF